MIKTKYDNSTNTLSVVIEKEFDSIALVYYDIFVTPINYIGAFYGNNVDALKIINIINEVCTNSYDAPGNICKIYLRVMKLTSDAYKAYSYVVFNNIIKWFREHCVRKMDEINIPNGEVYYFEDSGGESYFTANFSKATIEENPDKLSVFNSISGSAISTITAS